MSASKHLSRKNLPVYRAIRVAAISVLIILVFGYLDLGPSHIFGYIEELAYGDRLEVAGLCYPSLAKQAASNIKVISISDDTYEWASENGNKELTLPRTYFATLINRLTSYGTKVIVFDMLFDKPKPGDNAMAMAIKKSGKVVLGCEDNGERQLDVVYPAQIFIQAGAHLGLARVHLDVNRPEIDEVEPEVNTGSGLMPTLSVEAARVALGIADLPIGKAAGDNAIPKLPIATETVSDSAGSFPAFEIRYLFDDHYIYNGHSVFDWIPMEQFLSGGQGSDQIYRQVFQNKVVVIGDTTKLSGDLRLTPIEQMPGVIVQANALATLLSGKFIKEAKPLQQALMLAVLVSLTALLSTTWELRRVAVLLVLFLPLSALVNVWLFVQDNLYFHLAGPSLAIIFTAVCVLLERGLTEEDEKGRMKQLLGRYVNPRMAEHILKNPELIGGSGKLQVGTMLFTDVRGFTKLSEALSPEDLVSRMNEYFEEMIEVVFRHDGTAVNLIGDAMLVVFGIPVATPDHADRAVAAALEMQKATAALQLRWNIDDLSGVSSGIGINTGEVVVGEIGGSQLRNFTVYGLQVNIASRVETLNKKLDTNILITRSTYEALNKKIPVKGPTACEIRGVAEPIDIFEVVEG
jgi:class 3 adenylate cyclase/CHASE2 domain-containing sensor protein